MLKLVDIKKDYVTKGVPTVHALKGLTINFRRNEFVAILGASGCGKTTLLNIIGGLDRYSDGDLIIEGKSTRDYQDGDWDTYRNHSIGFVFQSYNLIMHQSLLKNVELALTISGVSKEERKQRALDALQRVGLEGMERKKPNQLSGGQMQRVAIARALVNNPEILLADEPTGALDSETSVQIMDLLKDVAKDRLVIMVTHNPDLAYQYANRIVRMSDGLLLDDSNPYGGESKADLDAALAKKAEIIAAKGNKKQSSMSFFTATGLSFANLVSKLKRTILIAVAGSIGIIGVSSVLAVSFGVQNYIDNMQDDMLSEYPIQISETAVDYTSLINGLSSWDKKELSNFDLKTEVGVDSMINYLMDKYQDFTSVKTNEIDDFLMAYVEGAPKESVAALSYNYGLDPTNNIFTDWVRGAGKTEGDKTAHYDISLNGLTQMYISELKTVSGFSQYAQFVRYFTNFLKELPAGEDYILSQYDLLGEKAHFPTNENEMLLVLDDDQTMTDFLFAQLGYFQENEFLNIAKCAIKLHEKRDMKNKGEITEEEYEQERDELYKKYPYPHEYKMTDILNKKFTYYPHDSIWTYKEKSIQSVRSTVQMYQLDPATFAPDPTKDPFDIKINVSYNEGEDILEGTASSSEFYNGLTFDVQMPRYDENGKDSEKDYAGRWVLFNYPVNEDNTMSLILVVNPDGTIYLTSEYGGSLLPPTVLGPVGVYTVKEENKNTYYYDAMAGTPDGIHWEDGQEMKIVGLLKKKEGHMFGTLSSGAYYTPALTKKLMKDAKDSNIVSHPLYGLKNYIGGEDENDGEPFEAFVEYQYTSFRKGDKDDEIQYGINGYANALNTGSDLSNLISFSSSSAFDTDKIALRQLCGQATKYLTNDDDIIVGYDFEDLPQDIFIYPKNFAEKNKITKYLDEWNDTKKDITVNIDGSDVTRTGAERDELTYIDTIELIIEIVNSLILAVTISLIVFTSLSLVVSCFMIAVITYISTMERVKEIGVIRSLGGRKKDVSRLFIAETLIIGLASGVIGVLVTYLLQLILNLSVMHLGVYGIAALPIWMALVMVALSIFLNVISGLIPSMKASKQDPVVALRTE